MRRLAACALAALLFALLGAPASQAAGPLRYVALGDSYSAASGVLPPDPTAPPPCLRSTSSLVRALAAVRAAAPSAEVAILGDPWILPRAGGCFDRMPVAEGDVPYLRGIQATLNDAVRQAAEATGATYVDLNTVSEGHDACQPLGVRWIEPVLQGTNPVIVHPNALGEQQVADRAMAVLGLR